MKKIQNILLVLLFAVFLPIGAIAQTNNTSPTDFGTSDETSVNPTDNAVPIDTNLWVLILVGSAFVFYKYQAVNKNRTNS